MAKARFEWDESKNRENWLKHGVQFATAQFAFADPRRVIAEDATTAQRSLAITALGLSAAV